MLEGFEEQTRPLTLSEKEIRNYLVRGLKHKIGIDKIMTNKQLREICRIHLNKKISPGRIRAIIRDIRMRDIIINLIATNKGYYVETDPSKLRAYKRSIVKRGQAILDLADKIKPGYNKWAQQPDLFSEKTDAWSKRKDLQ